MGRASDQDHRETVILARARAVPEGFVAAYGDLSPGAPRMAGAVLAACLLMLVCFWYVPLARRSPALASSFFGSFMSLSIGWSLGALGSLDQPWFASLYLAPLMGFPFLVPPGCE